MLLANFNGKEYLRHRAVSLRQHGFLVDLSVGDSRSQIAFEWFQIAQRSLTIMESLYETTIDLSNGAIGDPLRPPLHPKWCSLCSKIHEWAGHISATGHPDPLHCLVLGYGFWYRRIEWRYFRFISDSLRPPLSQNGGPDDDMTWHDMTEDIDKIWRFLLHNDIMSGATSPFAKLLWPLYYRSLWKLVFSSWSTKSQAVARVADRTASQQTISRP